MKISGKFLGLSTNDIAEIEISLEDLLFQIQAELETEFSARKKEWKKEIVRTLEERIKEEKIGWVHSHLADEPSCKKCYENQGMREAKEKILALLKDYKEEV